MWRESGRRCQFNARIFIDWMCQTHLQKPGKRRARFPRGARRTRRGSARRWICSSNLSLRNIRSATSAALRPTCAPFYLEAQQHNLNKLFGRIHRSVRSLRAQQVKELAARDAKTQDQKRELERFSVALDWLPVKQPRSGSRRTSCFRKGHD